MAASFNDLCAGCSRFVSACPVKIDIPWINTVVRDRINRCADDTFDWIEESLKPGDETAAIDLQKTLVANFETLAKLGSRTSSLSNWVSRLAPVRALMERFFGIDRRRTLPALQRETL